MRLVQRKGICNDLNVYSIWFTGDTIGWKNVPSIYNNNGSPRLIGNILIICYSSILRGGDSP